MMIIVRMMKRFFSIVYLTVLMITALTYWPVPNAYSCDGYSVRDAAFNEERDVHRFCYIAERNALVGSKTLNRLDDWLSTSDEELNIELVPLAADDPAVEWKDYGIPSAPPAWPVTVLAGRDTTERRSFFIDYWDPAPSSEALDALKTSPVREAIRQQIGTLLAVFLTIPAEEDGSIEETVNTVATQWSEKETLPVSVMRIDRNDKRERILLSFLGVKDNGRDRVAVVFGKGKILPPPKANEDTETYLNRQLESIIEKCSCLRSASSYGADLPMLWHKSQDEAVIPLRPLTQEIGKPWGMMANGETIDTPASTSGVRTPLFWTLAVLFLAVSSTSIFILYRRSAK